MKDKKVEDVIWGIYFILALCTIFGNSITCGIALLSWTMIMITMDDKENKQNGIG